MTDEDQVERLLRARPTTDARYEPALADLLDAERGAPVVGVYRWRYGNIGLARLLPLVLLGAAILLAATALFAGGVRPDRLIVVEPSQPTATQKPVRDFPVEGVTAILARFKASHWPATPEVILDVAILGDDGLWAATSGANADAVLGQGTYPGHSQVRVGGAMHLLVSMVALSLVDQGRLDLDAPVSQYVSVCRTARQSPSETFSTVRAAWPPSESRSTTLPDSSRPNRTDPGPLPTRCASPARRRSDSCLVRGMSLSIPRTRCWSRSSRA